ncbi:Histidine N-alpha-methyltransferase [Rubrivivax sp. A210]|uniref:L-histidine N(alpha)-methyltransferase n=1 Tax=Rubrivivax sp. A210 TaxID=2772301 RepID=UPI001919E6F9|nr:L-histidine N(alpha)-methyltransferase [Rubrivivax sp. A210]CAD5373643.1 Histidine N-alpha-methyltransferase [Rubrivivax sp. A210]
MREPRLIRLHQHDAASLGDEAKAGLLQVPARVSPKFFYDALGSCLFDAITELDEYYPTRTEAAILAHHGAAIAAAARSRLGSGATLVDLGAGDGAKAARLFPLLQPARYLAVDISAAFLGAALQALQLRHPALEIIGVGLDFSARLALPEGLLDGPALVFYPGSSIGNFAPAEALRLLREARALASGGALLIGVDLLKPVAVLEAAYDDALGVTAAFNLNLLRHLNRLLGADFALRQWRHRAFFNVQRACIEMHLHAREALTVSWPGGRRDFAAGEAVHTEDSFKWARADFEALLREAGFARVHSWTDERDWFAVMLAEA